MSTTPDSSTLRATVSALNSRLEELRGCSPVAGASTTETLKNTVVAIGAGLVALLELEADRRDELVAAAKAAEMAAAGEVELAALSVRPAPTTPTP